MGLELVVPTELEDPKIEALKALIQETEAGEALARTNWPKIQEQVRSLLRTQSGRQLGRAIGKSEPWVRLVKNWDPSEYATPFIEGNRQKRIAKEAVVDTTAVEEPAALMETNSPEVVEGGPLTRGQKKAHAALASIAYIDKESETLCAIDPDLVIKDTGGLPYAVDILDRAVKRLTNYRTQLRKGLPQ